MLQKGDIGWTRLESSQNDFERGAVDRFKIRGVDVGKLTSVGIKHDGSGFGYVRGRFGPRNT